ncbi:MAG TPA: CPBP family intramembrane glutamic endopeptidase [Pyrinomonadaceae bacterium]|nr:CPBP family intramembrane glutamic endopeptidase [Pyrinomonadaceae bacterium]
MFHAVWTIWVLVGYPRLRAVGEETLLYASVNLSVRAVIWVLPVFLYLRYVDGVSPADYLKLKKHWLSGIFWGLAFTVVVFVLSWAKQGPPHIRPGAITWNSILSTSLLIGFVEEVPYRGFIFQKLSESFSRTAAAVISSLLFVAIHLPGWLSLHLFTLHTMLFVFVFGAFMALLLVRAKSLWAPVIAHSLNDFLSAVLFR